MRKPFQATSTHVYRNWLIIQLNNVLDYKDKTSNSITVFNKPPFNTYKAGDDLMIDTEIVASSSQSAVFGEDAVSKRGF
ncbi:protein of unknown function [endosymbiont DhMRE of Dentiscutata heterogama]|uniref:hypothetical protein n=1 Tax=endosymbiont DhMRE of Dentiscutata heterogama TaxID=1609546 RepID=UPI000629D678|nr:hypothetical protein [endosymbiont DhMRE of Dentiscutata heterogama]CFW93417.1 protein of unknown function [endosymbiont DhMRE of Dentiscutata heterogama]